METGNEWSWRPSGTERETQGNDPASPDSQSQSQPLAEGTFPAARLPDQNDGERPENRENTEMPSQPTPQDTTRPATSSLEYPSDKQDTLTVSLTALGRPLRGRAAPGTRSPSLIRRPAAMALLAFFVLAFALTSFAPGIPLLRLSYDVADVALRASDLQDTFAAGPSALFNTANLSQAQGDAHAIASDLNEINSVMNIAGAPFAAASPAIQNYRLLTRIGYDLAVSADEGLQVASTLLTPLRGGALSADSSTPGITQANINDARQTLARAHLRVQDALSAYHSLNMELLPDQLKPGTKYGKWLALVPEIPAALDEMDGILNVAPQLLGIGSPAYYLVTAMDRSELRPGGGFLGNYGILGIQNGKQSKQYPLSLHDTYQLDAAYYERLTTDPTTCTTSGPQPPAVYWWWPYRDLGCDIGWGLRDSNLSPDFPTNASMAIQIAQASGLVPQGAPLQGAVAFTPVLIANLLRVTGPLDMPQYHVTVTSQNIESEIHQFQLGPKQPKTGDRKQFTSALAAALLARLKSLQGDGLKPVLEVAQQALKTKDLQIYFSNPQVELALRQLGLASAINTGGGDGFFVVDTNDGGNKANTYVTEHQTDYVTLLPDGGALHQLQIAVTYRKDGPVYDLAEHFQDYNDVQRTYLPADATILGYTGFNPPIFHVPGCYGSYTSPITDCSSPGHALTGPSTVSDVPGRTMVMGSLLVMCGPARTLATYNSTTDYAVCNTTPVPHTQTIYISWYTPHAFTMDATGHGSYSELVERQAGSVASLTVYIDTSRLHAASAASLAALDTNPQIAAVQFARLIAGKHPVFSGPLETNTTVSLTF